MTMLHVPAHLWATFLATQAETQSCVSARAPGHSRITHVAVSTRGTAVKTLGESQDGRRRHQPGGVLQVGPVAEAEATPAALWSAMRGWFWFW